MRKLSRFQVLLNNFSLSFTHCIPCFVLDSTCFFSFVIQLFISYFQFLLRVFRRSSRSLRFPPHSGALCVMPAGMFSIDSILAGRAGRAGRSARAGCKDSLLLTADEGPLLFPGLSDSLAATAPDYSGVYSARIPAYSNYCYGANAAPSCCPGSLPSQCPCMPTGKAPSHTSNILNAHLSKNKYYIFFLCSIVYACLRSECSVSLFTNFCSSGP